MCDPNLEYDTITCTMSLHGLFHVILILNSTTVFPLSSILEVVKIRLSISHNSTHVLLLKSVSNLLIEILELGLDPTMLFALMLIEYCVPFKIDIS